MVTNTFPINTESLFASSRREKENRTHLSEKGMLYIFKRDTQRADKVGPTLTTWFYQINHGNQWPRQTALFCIVQKTK